MAVAIVEGWPLYRGSIKSESMYGTSGRMEKNPHRPHSYIALK